MINLAMILILQVVPPRTTLNWLTDGTTVKVIYENGLSSSGPLHIQRGKILEFVGWDKKEESQVCTILTDNDPHRVKLPYQEVLQLSSIKLHRFLTFYSDPRLKYINRVMLNFSNDRTQLYIQCDREDNSDAEWTLAHLTAHFQGLLSFEPKIKQSLPLPRHASSDLITQFSSSSRLQSNVNRKLPFSVFFQEGKIHVSKDSVDPTKSFCKMTQPNGDPIELAVGRGREMRIGTSEANLSIDFWKEEVVSTTALTIKDPTMTDRRVYLLSCEAPNTRYFFTWDMMREVFGDLVTFLN